MRPSRLPLSEGGASSHEEQPLITGLFYAVCHFPRLLSVFGSPASWTEEHPAPPPHTPHSPLQDMSSARSADAVMLVASVSRLVETLVRRAECDISVAFPEKLKQVTSAGEESITK